MIREVTNNFIVNAKPNSFAIYHWTGEKGSTRLLNDKEITTRKEKMQCQ
jgi:hypothetical protein